MAHTQDLARLDLVFLGETYELKLRLGEKYLRFSNVFDFTNYFSEAFGWAGSMAFFRVWGKGAFKCPTSFFFTFEWSVFFFIFVKF